MTKNYSLNKMWVSENFSVPLSQHMLKLLSTKSEPFVPQSNKSQRGLN